MTNKHTLPGLALMSGLAMVAASDAKAEEIGLRGAVDGQMVASTTTGAEDTAPSSNTASTGNETIVVSQDIRSLIQDFATRIGVQARISSSVRGTVQNRRLPGDPEAFLNALAGDFGLGWFFDGPVLYVNAASEYATRLIGLGRFSYGTLIDQLTAAGLTTQRFSLRELPDANALIVTGPPEYIARIEVILEALRAKQGGTGNIRIIRHGRVVRTDGQ